MNVGKPGVIVTVTNTVTQESYSLITDINGRVSFVGIPPGEYTSNITMPNGYIYKEDDSENAIVDSNGLNNSIIRIPFTGVDVSAGQAANVVMVIKYGTALNTTIPILGATTPITSISSAGAISGGVVTNTGNASITQRGLCWSLHPNPTISDSKVIIDAGQLGSFSGSLYSLTPNSSYYVRSFATNSAGTGYGTSIQFTTDNEVILEPPVVYTGSITGFGTNVSAGGNVVSDGGMPVTVRGICWNTAANPTTSLSTKTLDGTGLGVFASSITGLTIGTTYHVRAYATNSEGTSYGQDVAFVATSAATIPTLVTTAISNNEHNEASSGGTISNDGGSTITQKGVCWGTISNPTIANITKTNNGASTGTFVSSISGLTIGTTYYVRAYATNGIGTAYGNQITFVAAASLPNIETISINTFDQTTGTFGVNLVDDGGADINEMSIRVGTSSGTYGMTLPMSNITAQGEHYANKNNLTPNTVYYYIAHATNSVGSSWGTEKTFTTSTVQVSDPTVNTKSATNIISTGVDSGADNISSDFIVYDTGICWGTSLNPTIDDSKFNTGNKDNTSFIHSITGLNPNTLYHIRAFVQRDDGSGAFTTFYGDDEVFTTAAITGTAPSIMLVDSSHTENSVTIVANITNVGSSALTEVAVYCNGTKVVLSDVVSTGQFSYSFEGKVSSTSFTLYAQATNAAGTSQTSSITVVTDAPHVYVVGDTYGGGIIYKIVGNQYYLLYVGSSSVNAASAISEVTSRVGWSLFNSYDASLFKNLYVDLLTNNQNGIIAAFGLDASSDYWTSSAYDGNNTDYFNLTYASGYKLNTDYASVLLTKTIIV